MEERENLIPLQASHVTQLTDKTGNISPWEVQENKTNDLLAVLPREFTEKQVFRVLHFARKFELIAFNIGMKHMHSELGKNFEIEKQKLIRVINGLETANNKLAEKLGSFIGEEV